MDKAKHYRGRAEEIRTIAKGIFNRQERKTLLEIAREYEKMALRGDAGEGSAPSANGGQKRANGGTQKPRRNSGRPTAL